MGLAQRPLRAGARSRHRARGPRQTDQPHSSGRSFSFEVYARMPSPADFTHGAPLLVKDVNLLERRCHAPTSKARKPGALRRPIASVPRLAAETGAFAHDIYHRAVPPRRQGRHRHRRGGRGNSIGRAYALGLANAGASVVVADINEAGAKPSPTKSARRAARPSACGWTSPTRRRPGHGRGRDGGFGGVDILVNNAATDGGTRHAAVADVSLEEWNRILEVNVTGALICVRLWSPRCAQRGGGRDHQPDLGRRLPGDLDLRHQQARAGRPDDHACQAARQAKRSTSTPSRRAISPRTPASC